MLGQVIGIAGLPIIGRCYSPEAFGIFGIYASAVGILAVVATLKYEVAILVPGNERDALSLIDVCFFTTGITVLAIYVMFGMMRLGYVPMPVQVRMLGDYGWLVPVGVAIAALARSLAWWAVRTKDFSAMASTKLWQGVYGVLIQITMGILSDGPVGLIAGNMAGLGVGVRRLAPLAWRQDRVDRRRFQNMARVAVEYRHFPAFVWPAALFSICSLNVPPLFITAMYGPGAGGNFFWTQRLISIPLVLIGQAVGHVVHGQAAETMRSDPRAVGNSFRATVGQLAIVAVPFLIFSNCAPWLFPLVIGEQWREAGGYAQSLSWPAAMELVATSSSILAPLGYGRLQLGWDAGRFVTIAVGCACCAWLDASAGCTVMVYGGIQFAWQVILLVLNASVIRAYSRRGVSTLRMAA